MQDPFHAFHTDLPKAKTYLAAYRVGSLTDHKPLPIQQEFRALRQEIEEEVSPPLPHTRTRMHAYMDARSHAYSCIFVHIHVYSHILTHIHAYSCIFTHIHAYSCIVTFSASD